MTHKQTVDELIKLGDKVGACEWSCDDNNGCKTIHSGNTEVMTTDGIYPETEDMMNAFFVVASANAREAIKAMRDENEILHLFKDNARKTIKELELKNERYEKALKAINATLTQNKTYYADMKYIKSIIRETLNQTEEK